MERALAGLRRRQAETFGVSGTYSRRTKSTTHTCTPTMWLGRTGMVSNLQDAARLEWSELDLCIVASELVLDEETTTPAKGDRITLTLAGNEVEMALMIPSSGEPSWRYSDPQRTIYRVHCKRV